MNIYEYQPAHILIPGVRYTAKNDFLIKKKKSYFKKNIS